MPQNGAHGTLLLLGLCCAFKSLLLPPRSAPVASPPGLTTRLPSNHRALLLPFAKKKGGGSSARLTVFHFQGQAIRQVGCYTLLSGCRLPWPPPCCLDSKTPFPSSKSALRHFSPPFGSPRIAGSAYQKRPTRPKNKNTFVV